MNKLKKYQLFEFLKVFKKNKCKTIDDIIKLINNDLKNDDDIVFAWKEEKYWKEKKYKKDNTNNE